MKRLPPKFDILKTLDPYTYVVRYEDLEEDLRGQGLELGDDWVLYRDGKPQGSVTVVDDWVFQLYNPATL